MIQIIAHRGYWKSPKEKNTFLAFERALDLGFGIETDFRDRTGILVVEHDLPTSNSLPASDFFDLVSRYNSRGPLALNIKADGLHILLQNEIQRRDLKNYFCFDASIPDSLKYTQMKIPYFHRLSEFEPWTQLVESASGLWLDQFQKNWYSAGQLSEWLKNQTVCIVSPELHRRPHLELWSVLREAMAQSPVSHQPSICTDFPEEAQAFFNT